MNDMATEKTLEKKLREEIQKLGGLAIKFFSAWFTGMPDRMVLMPGGLIWFVEMKSPGKNVGKKGRQPFVIKLLLKLGFKVRVVNTQELLTEFLNEVKNAR
jgi:hypothetical protein